MDGCVMTALSWDGVYLNSRLQQDIFFVPAGGRVDLEVLCAEAGHYELRSQANLLMKLVTEVCSIFILIGLSIVEFVYVHTYHLCNKHTLLHHLCYKYIRNLCNKHTSSPL